MCSSCRSGQHISAEVWDRQGDRSDCVFWKNLNLLKRCFACLRGGGEVGGWSLRALVPLSGSAPGASYTPFLKTLLYLPEPTESQAGCSGYWDKRPPLTPHPRLAHGAIQPHSPHHRVHLVPWCFCSQGAFARSAFPVLILKILPLQQLPAQM